jgi:uncharacterized protein (UPF0261 family)
MPTVVLPGTLDTKGIEFAYVRDRLRAYGCQVILIDVGLVGAPQAEPDITRDAVAAAGGATVAALLGRDDRGAALEAMACGATRLVADLHREGRLHALMSLGGSGGSSIAAAAMRALPIGVPKLLVSTIASGDVSSYVGQSDITMMYAVLDVAGLNSVSTAIYENAAAAAAGMAGAFAARTASQHGKPAIAVTMFGVTTPAVTVARQWLEAQGYEVFVFHANGAGGRAMEKLIADGTFVGVLDLTTTELADELVGGDLSAGPNRLTAAGRRGIPQVVSLGALDMVNFGPSDRIPARFHDRRFYRHNQNVTLMRTTAAECAELGCILGTRLNAARGSVTLFIPRGGVSSISEPGQVFDDREVDEALFTSLTATVSQRVTVVQDDRPINDAGLATAMAVAIHELISRSKEDFHV